MVDPSAVQFTSEDRVLIILNDNTINGTTRLQKYGFLLAKQYVKELSSMSERRQSLTFYDDWEALWYGPFSRGLQKDVEKCVGGGLVTKEPMDASTNSYRYALTIRGRARWRKMLAEFQNETIAICEKISSLQKMRQERLLEGIYNAYPEYTKRSTIKDRFR